MSFLTGTKDFWEEDFIGKIFIILIIFYLPVYITKKFLLDNW